MSDLSIPAAAARENARATTGQFSVQNRSLPRSLDDDAVRFGLRSDESFLSEHVDDATAKYGADAAQKAYDSVARGIRPVTDGSTTRYAICRYDVEEFHEHAAAWHDVIAAREQFADTIPDSERSIFEHALRTGVLFRNADLLDPALRQDGYVINRHDNGLYSAYKASAFEAPSSTPMLPWRPSSGTPVARVTTAGIERA